MSWERVEPGELDEALEEALAVEDGASPVEVDVSSLDT